jgi:hypothetical protein
MQMLSHVEAHVNNLGFLMPIFYICFPSAAVMKCSPEEISTHMYTGVNNVMH